MAYVRTHSAFFRGLSIISVVVLAAPTAKWNDVLAALGITLYRSLDVHLVERRLKLVFLYPLYTGERTLAIRILRLREIESRSVVCRIRHQVSPHQTEFPTHADIPIQIASCSSDAAASSASTPSEAITGKSSC